MTLYVLTEKELVADKTAWQNGIVVERNQNKITQAFIRNKQVIATGTGSAARVNMAIELLVKHLKRAGDSLNRDYIDLSSMSDEFSKIAAGDSYFEVLFGIIDEFNKKTFYVLSSAACYPVRVETFPYVGGHPDSVLVAHGALDAGATAEAAMQIAMKRTGIASDVLETTTFSF